MRESGDDIRFIYLDTQPLAKKRFQEHTRTKCTKTAKSLSNYAKYLQNIPIKPKQPT